MTFFERHDPPINDLQVSPFPAAGSAAAAKGAISAILYVLDTWFIAYFLTQSSFVCLARGCYWDLSPGSTIQLALLHSPKRNLLWFDSWRSAFQLEKYRVTSKKRRHPERPFGVRNHMAVLSLLLESLRAQAASTQSPRGWISHPSCGICKPIGMTRRQHSITFPYKDIADTLTS